MTKLSKILKYLAVSAFLLALVVNVKVSLSDPFITMSEEAVAQMTSSGFELEIITNDAGSCYCCQDVSGSGIEKKCDCEYYTHTCDPGSLPCIEKIEIMMGNCKVTGYPCEVPVEPYYACP